MLIATANWHLIFHFQYREMFSIFHSIEKIYIYIYKTPISCTYSIKKKYKYIYKWIAIFRLYQYTERYLLYLSYLSQFINIYIYIYLYIYMNWDKLERYNKHISVYIHNYFSTHSTLYIFTSIGAGIKNSFRSTIEHFSLFH